MSLSASSRSGSSVWTPARIFMVVSAVWHLPLGIAGLAIDQTFPIGPGDAAAAGSEHVFGIFETNGWHSLAAVILGVISLLFAVRHDRAREAALAIGIFHVGVVAALMLWQPETFWLASNGADQVVHSSTAVGGILSGLLTPRRVSDDQGVATRRGAEAGA